MGGAGGKSSRRLRLISPMLLLAIVAFPAIVIAADFPGSIDVPLPTGPRYFPRDDGTESFDQVPSRRQFRDER